MAHCFFWQMKCKVYSRGFLYDVFCKRTFLFLIISFHLLLVVELNSDLQINNCNRWVIWHTRNGLLTIMPWWPRFFPFLALLQTNHTGWFLSEENSCNDIMLLILSFTVHSEVLWVASVMLSIRVITGNPEFEAAQLPVCALSCWWLLRKWWWDAWTPWVPFLFKVFPNRSCSGFDPRFALLYRRYLHV